MYQAGKIAHDLQVRWKHTIVGADWNVNYFRDHIVKWNGFPHARLTFNGFHTGCNRNPGTLGHRLIDTWYWHGARCLSGHTIFHTVSDHNFTWRSIKLGK